MTDPQNHPSRYGARNLDYIATWGPGPDTDPMWALNLMHYREYADYPDGRDSTISGQDADDRYAPFEPLAAVGARVVLVAPVVEQLAGEDVTWDRIAIVRYPTRQAMAEMDASPEFQALHVHKEAGMASTIVAATYPRPETVSVGSGIRADDLLLLQLVADADAPDVASVHCIPFATFDVDGVIIGDGRTWSEARWHVVPATEVDAVRDTIATQDASLRRYVVLMQPMINELGAALGTTSS